MSLSAHAAQTTSLTIYSTARPGAIPPEWYRPLPESMGGGTVFRQVPGYAVVRQDRSFDIGAGRSTVRFTDVAALIDPTTVTFSSLTDPKTTVIEQSYQFDLVSTAKLLERFIDREITLEQARGDQVARFTGKLLSTAGGAVLQMPDGGVQIVNGYASAMLPSLPGGLMTQPTLVWDVESEKAGPQQIRVSYQTSGITWWADYNIVFTEGAHANAGVLDVGAWVSILNQSGGSYPEATLKLIAGDVQRAAPPETVAEMMPMMARAAGAKAAGFEEKAFFEYHLYTLGRPTTIPDRSTRQIELFDAARGVPCEKVLVYDGLGTSLRGMYGAPLTERQYGVESNKKVDIYLQFKNSESIGMGMPLPSGRIRVSKLDPADGSLEFIGEDTIDHTPKNEEVRIKLGSAFDVVGERRQVDFRIDTGRKLMEEEIEVKVRNHKDEAVEVVVQERLFRWVNWEMLKASHKHEKLDARTIKFPVKIDKNGEAVVRYSVRYTW